MTAVEWIYISYDVVSSVGFFILRSDVPGLIHDFDSLTVASCKLLRVTFSGFLVSNKASICWKECAILGASSRRTSSSRFSCSGESRLRYIILVTYVYGKLRVA